MSTRKRIDGLRRQVAGMTDDQTVAAISKLMDELSAEAAGGSHQAKNTLQQLFDEATQYLLRETKND